MAKEGAESDKRCEVINFTGEIRDATTTFDLFSQVSLDNAPINWIPIPISRETLLLVYRCLDEISMQYLRDALRIFTNRDFYVWFEIFHASIPSFEFFDLKQCHILKQCLRLRYAYCISVISKLLHKYSYFLIPLNINSIMDKEICYK